MVNGVACTSEHTKPMAIAAANMKNERIGSAKDQARVVQCKYKARFGTGHWAGSKCHVPEHTEGGVMGSSAGPATMISWRRRARSPRLFQHVAWPPPGPGAAQRLS